MDVSFSINITFSKGHLNVFKILIWNKPTEQVPLDLKNVFFLSNAQQLILFPQKMERKTKQNQLRFVSWIKYELNNSVERGIG